jgi:hypothetical protein
LISIKLEEEIEKHLDDIIKMGEALINTYSTEAEKSSQIRNLIEIASSIDSVKALEIFIKYQMGRDYLRSDFGEALIGKIEEMGKLAKQIAKENPEQQKMVWLRLNRLFLGYLHRYSVYIKRKIREEKREEE